MAVSGTIPSRRTPRPQATQIARWVRRITLVVTVAAGAWFFLKFGTRWVPAGMNTMPDIPAGSWVIVDRWASGLRVGSDVFIETPRGEILSRVTGLTETEVVIENLNRNSSWIDSATFGPLPRANVAATIVVTFAPQSAGGADAK